MDQAHVSTISFSSSNQGAILRIREITMVRERITVGVTTVITNDEQQRR